MALAELQEQLATAGSASDGAGLAAKIAEVKLQMQAEREAALQELAATNETSLKKARKATLLMVCLQNRVREMVDAKLTAALDSLQEKDSASASLREDMQDVTEQHSKRVTEMRAAFEKEKQDETAAIIAKHEAQMAEFEAKIRQDK